MEIYINTTKMTEYISDVGLYSSTDTLGMSVSIKVTNNNDLYISAPTINIADQLTIFGDENNEVFRGIILSKDTSLTQFDFHAQDFGFYLRKSKDIIQLNGVVAHTAIRQLLNKYSVPIGSIPTMNILITKIYYDEYISDILADILEYVKALTGQHYYLDFSGGKFNIVGNIYVNPAIKISDNVSSGNINDYLYDTSSTESFEDLKNKIVAYTEDDDNVQTLVTVKDDVNINKYGLLSDVINIAEDDVQRANYLASAELIEKNIVSKTYKFGSLGSFDVLANRIIYINDDVINVASNARVLDVTHSISNGIHRMSGEVELI